MKRVEKEGGGGQGDVPVLRYSWFLGASKRLYKILRPLVCWLVGWSVGCSVSPHITLRAFFSAVCGWIDLKFGRDLHVDLLLQFLFFFFSTPPLNLPSPPSPQNLKSSIRKPFIKKLMPFVFLPFDNRDIYFSPQPRK
jgi:hypothetical protein